jgi:hypothetical protein
VLAMLHPFGQHFRTGVNVALSHLGTQGLGALVAWTDPNKPVYMSINDAGVVSVIRTPAR